jgi:hypothetical protein
MERHTNMTTIAPRHPDDEYNWKTFITWVEQTIRDHGNFEMNTYSEWTSARQNPDQSPWTFDAYLTSLECELEPASERTRAMDFLSKLQPSLKQTIDLSGVNPLPQTRQEMVSLATRMWEGLKKKDRWQKREEKPALRNHCPAPGPQSNRGQRTQEKGQTTDQKTGRGKGQKFAWKSQFPKEFASGKNDRGESICYRCGSTKHLSFDHAKETEEAADKTKAESKETPTIKIIKTPRHKKGHNRIAERIKRQELTDSENK